MKLSEIFSDLPFAEWVLDLHLPDDKIYVNGTPGLSPPPDLHRIHSLLLKSKADAFWADYREITTNPGDSGLQMDLLGYISEPVFVFRNTNYPKGLLFKFIHYETNKDFYYGKDQKFLIEKLIQCRLTPSDTSLKPEIIESPSISHVVKNQHYKYDNLKNRFDSLILELCQWIPSVILPSEPEQNGSDISRLSENSLNYLLGMTSPALIREELTAAIQVAMVLKKDGAFSGVIESSFFPGYRASEKINISSPLLKNNEIAKAKPAQNTLNSAGTPVNTSRPADITERTKQLLNRYEAAVQTLISSNIPVMGKNIASACIPPISAPALTDSINKHRDRIRQCLLQFPGQWPNLRKLYSPVAQLDTKSIG